jgi:hypothetical protein
VIRTLVLVAAVWLFLYGAAEVLGLMPRMESSPAVVVDSPEVSEPPAPSVEAPQVVAVPVRDAATAPDVEDGGGVEDGVCRRGDREPLLHEARLPSGAAAVLVDCGGFAELIVPDVSASRATVVAELTYDGPLLRVEAKDLTGDGREDLAFAFADRLVLLPTNALGVWAEPRTLEGWRGGAPEATRAEEETPSRLLLGRFAFTIVSRGETRALAVERESETPAVLRLERAALMFRAALREAPPK